MNKRVLVLNQDYRPIMVCSVQRAFLLTFLKKTEMIERVDGRNIRTVSNTYPMPAVIKLIKYVNIPYKGVNLTRLNVFKRDNFECQYCGATKDLTLDHVIPKSLGGKSTWKNLTTACKHCNARKGDYLPEEAGMLLKMAPFKPSYVIFLRDFSGYLCEEWKPYLEDGVKVG